MMRRGRIIRSTGFILIFLSFLVLCFPFSAAALVRKPPPKTNPPMKPGGRVTAPGGGKDAIVPILAQLAQRHLSGVSDKNDLDDKFESLLSRHPKITRSVLEQIVDGYNAIPIKEKQARFVIPDVQTNGTANSAPLTQKSVQAMLMTSSGGHGKFPDAEPGTAVQVTKPNRDVNVPIINSITPDGAEPGDTIYIAGRNFQAGYKHTIVFSPESDQPGGERSVVVSAPTDTKITCRIPGDIYAGEYEIHVEAPGTNTDVNAVDYEIAAPKYRVTFDKMKCIDESRGPKDEKVFKDSLVTFWIVVADDEVWSKNSKKYKPFEDGSSMSYDSGDKYVLPPSNGYQEARAGIAVQASLYEWNVTSVDPSTVQGVIEFSTDMADVVYDYGGGLWDVVDLLANAVDDLIDAIVDIFTKDPVYLGTQQIVYKAPDLQGMLDGGEEKSGKMSFSNNDETGSYELTYTIRRK